MTPVQEAPASPRDVWNTELKANGGHLLQSWEWGEFKSRHGWEPERIHVSGADGEGWAQVLFRHRGPISLGYLPRGPLMSGDPTRVWPELKREIDRTAGRHRAMSIIIEPNDDMGLSGPLSDYGMVEGPEHLQPSRTVRIPLLDDEAILKQMHQKTRYSVRLALRRGVDVSYARAGDQQAIDDYYTLMEDTANRNEFHIHSREYYADFLDVFGDDAFFVFANWEGNLSAVVMAAAFGDEGAYMYGATSTEHRGHGAAFLLQFEAMKWARDRGAKWYDLWGIPKEDPKSICGADKAKISGTKGDDWSGMYRFKTGFGGEIVTLPDTLERRYLPLLPWIARRAGIIQG